MDKKFIIAFSTSIVLSIGIIFLFVQYKKTSNIEYQLQQEQDYIMQIQQAYNDEIEANNTLIWYNQMQIDELKKSNDDIQKVKELQQSRLDQISYLLDNGNSKVFTKVRDDKKLVDSKTTDTESLRQTKNQWLSFTTLHWQVTTIKNLTWLSKE